MPGGAAIYDSARLTSEKAHICSWKSNNNHAITHLSSPSLVTSQKLLPHKGKEKINKFNKHDTVEWTMGTMSIRCVARWCVRINPGFVVRIMPSRRKPHKHSSLHFWRIANLRERSVKVRTASDSFAAMEMPSKVYHRLVWDQPTAGFQLILLEYHKFYRACWSTTAVKVYLWFH